METTQAGVEHIANHAAITVFRHPENVLRGFGGTAPSGPLSGLPAMASLPIAAALMRSRRNPSQNGLTRTM